MKKVLVVLFLFSSYLYASEFPYKVEGTICDINNKPICCVNVLVKDTLENYIKGAVSDSLGHFILNISKGRYLLSVNSISYKSYFMTIDINNDINLTNIILDENINELNEIEITAQLPKIIYKEGKYIVDIEHSINATGSTVESLLDKIPGVWLSNGIINVNGKEGTKIYINDRLLNMSGEALLKYLNTLRSEDISKIEILPNPSSEYSAEGAGGIIKIITKSRKEGFSVMASTKFDKQKYSGISPYLSLQYNKNKFGVSLSFNAQKAKWLFFSDKYSKDLINDIVYQTKDSDTNYDNNYSCNLNLYYDYNKRNKIALNTNYLFWGKDENIIGNTDINGAQASDITKTISKRSDIQKQKYYSITLNYKHLLDTCGKKSLLFIMDYNNQYSYNTKNYFNYINKNNYNDTVSIENTLNNQESPYQLFSTEIKYAGDYGNFGKFSTGIKYGKSSINNEFSNFELISGTYKKNDTIGYNYQYNEDLISAYIQYNYSREKWSIVAGLRGEYTNGVIVNYSPPQKRFNLFPALFYNYNINNKNFISLSLTRRIQRVSYMKLIPKRFYSSRYSIIEGNQYLEPNILYNIGLDYNYNRKFYFSASYNWNNNAISSYTKTELTNNTSYIVSTYIDGIRLQDFNFNAYIPITFTKWWMTTNRFDMDYEYYITPDDKSHAFNYSLFTQHDFILPNNTKGEVLYRFFSKNTSPYTISNPYHLLNLSLMKSLYANKINVKIEANRILNNQKMVREIATNQAISRTSMYYVNIPYFSLTISYSLNIGKKSNFEEIKNSNTQEKSRTY